MQQSLFVRQPLRDQANADHMLSQVLYDYRAGKLKDAPFQRDKAWSGDQIAGWADSVRKHTAIGVIVTYQLRNEEVEGGGHPIWLNDGKQRLTASLDILENPTLYGFIDASEATVYMENFSITLQHRLYDTHDEALRAFQALNQGTAAEPGDYYKGELTRVNHGLHAFTTLPEIVREVGIRVCRRDRSRISNSTLARRRRDALAQFYQYVTQTEVTEFWGVQQTKVHRNDTPIETLLADWLSDKTIDEVNRSFQSFERFIDSQTALMRSLLTDIQSEGKAISLTFYRSLLHFSIFRKNIHWPVPWQEQVMRTLFDLAKSGGSLLTHLSDDGEITTITLSLGHLRWLKRTCRLSNLDYPVDIKRKRKRRPQTLEGFDNSHIEPFRDNGDGETFIEAAPLNRSRGAKTVAD